MRTDARKDPQQGKLASNWECWLIGWKLISQVIRTSKDSPRHKNAPSTPQELQANLRNTTNGASSGRLHSDAQVNLAKPPKH